MQDTPEAPTPAAETEATVETPVAETPVETPEAPETPPETPEAPVETKKWKLKVSGQDIEVEDEAELIALAQKGFDYDKRVQSLSALEKANLQKLQLADQLMTNQSAVKYALAQQLGYDPRMVLEEIPAPDPQYRETNPEWFGRQQAIFELARDQKQKFEAAIQGMVSLNAQTSNMAVFEKARLDNNLSDEQFQNVQAFVSQRMRPNQMGFFSSEDVDYAVMALYGKERIASEKLKQATKIQNTIKQATTPRATPVKPPKGDLSPEEKDSSEFKKHVQERSGGWRQGV